MTAAVRSESEKESGGKPVRLSPRARRSSSLPPPSRSLKAETEKTKILLKRLLAAREKVAWLVLQDSAYAPIFQRLEREIERAQSFFEADLLGRARAIVAQNEMGRSKAVT